VPAEDQSIVEYFKQEAEILAQVEQNIKKKQDLDNKLKVLYRRLINKELSPDILVHLKNAIKGIFNLNHPQIKAMQSNNLMAANNYISALSSMCWDRNKEWIQAFKRIFQFKSQIKK